MNKAHLEFLASPEWAHRLETDLLPWIEQVADLGDDAETAGQPAGVNSRWRRFSPRRM